MYVHSRPEYHNTVHNTLQDAQEIYNFRTSQITINIFNLN